MRRLLYMILFLIFSSCVDEINLDTGGQEARLVVDGWISNDPELSYVKIYYNAPYQSGTFYFHFQHPVVQRIYVETLVEGAVIDFKYNGPTSLRPIPIYIPEVAYTFSEGEQYRLNILLEDNSHYQSSWHGVAPASGIQDYEYDVVQKVIFIRNVNGPPIQQRQYFLDIKANIEKIPGVDYGYYIKTSGIEEAITFSLEDEFCTCTCYVPFPYVYEGLNVAYMENHPGTVMQKNIGSLTMGKLFRFWIKTDVYAVNSAQARYLLSISDQQKNSGSIFDPMPSKIKGDIRNLNDENEEVLGHFFTAHHTSNELMVNRTHFFAANPTLNYYIEGLQEVDHTCLEIYTTATITVPIPFQ